MPMLAELVDAVVGVDTHRDTHQVEIALPNGAPIAVDHDQQRHHRLRRVAGLDRRPRPRTAAGASRSRAPAATASGWPAPPPRPGSSCSSANSPTARPAAGAASPTRSTPTWPCWPRCAWTPTGCPPRARTATARRCASCSAPARNSPPPAPRRPTGCAHCCWAGTTPTASSPAARSPTTRLAGLARRRPPREASREQAVRHAEIRRLALALREAARALKANRAQLQTIVNDLVPGFTERRGIGPVSAAQAIVSFSHPGRCRNDAAFAALGGASPLPASSGRTVRHRLNRGGDRALNRALHTIATTRMRSCPTTQAYVARRTAEGKNPREIRRCLKRYIARQLYRTLTASTALTTPTRRLPRPLDKHRSVYGWSTNGASPQPDKACRGRVG